MLAKRIAQALKKDSLWKPEPHENKPIAQISKIGEGDWAVGGAGTPIGKRQRVKSVLRAIDAAHDGGYNFVQIYGNWGELENKPVSIKDARRMALEEMTKRIAAGPFTETYRNFPLENGEESNLVISFYRNGDDIQINNVEKDTEPGVPVDISPAEENRLKQFLKCMD